jgi:hypothetical protein
MFKFLNIACIHSNQFVAGSYSLGTILVSLFSSVPSLNLELQSCINSTANYYLATYIVQH